MADEAALSEDRASQFADKQPSSAGPTFIIHWKTPRPAAAEAEEPGTAVDHSELEEVTRAARHINPSALVWKCDPSTPLSERGVAGAWTADLQLVTAQLASKSQEP